MIKAILWLTLAAVLYSAPEINVSGDHPKTQESQGNVEKQAPQPTTLEIAPDENLGVRHKVEGLIAIQPGQMFDPETSEILRVCEKTCPKTISELAEE